MLGIPTMIIVEILVGGGHKPELLLTSVSLVCGPLARFQLAAHVFHLWRLHGISLTLPTLYTDVF
ncbi:hypothetical protein LEMLEM_LOCUS13741, partial [Lemmus lemmus]